MVTVVATGAYARFYSLDQLLDATMKNSLQLKRAKKEIDRTELDIQKTLSAAYPGVGLSVNALHLTDLAVAADIANVMNSPQDATTALVLQNQNFAAGELSADRLMTSLIVRQPLFLQGKILYGVKIGRARQHVAVCIYEETKKKVVTETKKNYYKVLLEQGRLTCAKEKLEQFKEHHRLACIEFNLGYATKLDTLKSQLSVEQAELEVLRTESERSKAAEALILKSGVAESPATLWIEDDLPEPVFFITIDEAVREMQEFNSTIRQFKGVENIAEYRLVREKLAYLPQVYAGASLNTTSPLWWQRGVELGKSMEFGAVFAGLSWQLFSGLSTKRSIEIARNEYDQILLKHQQEAYEIENRVRVLFEDVVFSQQRIEVLKKVIVLNENIVAEEQGHYRAGDLTAVDTKESSLSLLEATLQYQEQLYLFHCALLDFRLLIGSQV